MIQRSSGVFLNISSLPGDFGIGDFSTSATNFIESMLDMGFHWWQMLPITTIGDGNSPYSGISLMAGNYLYVDPYSLQSQGLLTQDEVESLKYHGDPFLVNYEHAKWAKKEALRIAFSRFEFKEEMYRFVSTNENWLLDYAVFKCLKDEFELPWIEWEDKYKNYSKELVEEYIANNLEKIEYYYFEQYIFFSQWYKLKRIANDMGMGIIGDLPIYPMHDSVDVWSNREMYKLGDDFKSKLVAGVPPDYFSKNGQLWGNPVYDFPKMAESDYTYLRNRFNYLQKIYDYTKIDHFRGFYRYWAVDCNEKTAINGKWFDGPKMGLFKHLKNANLIAEDLGIIGENVTKFLKSCGYPGMRVMHFGFTDDDSKHLPHFFEPNTVGYLGTHDNNTSLGWLYSIDEPTRNYVLDYCGEKGAGWGRGGGDCPATKAMIKTLISSCANLVIVTFQDLCGYGSDTRLNIPGKPDNNWRYRATYGAISSIDREFILKMNNLYGRNRPYFEEC